MRRKDARINRCSESDKQTMNSWIQRLDRARNHESYYLELFISLAHSRPTWSFSLGLTQIIIFCNYSPISPISPISGLSHPFQAHLTYPLRPTQSSDLSTDYRAKFSHCLDPMLEQLASEGGYQSCRERLQISWDNNDFQMDLLHLVEATAMPPPPPPPHQLHPHTGAIFASSCWR